MASIVTISYVYKKSREVSCMYETNNFEEQCSNYLTPNIKNKACRHRQYNANTLKTGEVVTDKRKNGSSRGVSSKGPPKHLLEPTHQSSTHVTR